MNTRTTPISYTELTALNPSLTGVAGGDRIYGLNGASNTVTVYLPPPVAGTVLRFFALNVTNAVSVNARTTATILGSSTTVVTLAKVGDCVEFVATATDWIVQNFGTINVRP